MLYSNRLQAIKRWKKKVLKDAVKVKADDTAHPKLLLVNVLDLPQHQPIAHTRSVIAAQNLPTKVIAATKTQEWALWEEKFGKTT